MIQDSLGKRLTALADLLERPPSSELHIGRLRPGGSELTIHPSDDFAAVHYQVLCHDIPPAASVFVDEKGMMGGMATQRIWMTMNRFGFVPDTSSISADHLSNALRFIGALQTQGKNQEAGSFVRKELMAWVPVFLNRLELSEQPEIVQLAGVLEDVLVLVADESTPDESGPSESKEGGFFSLPQTMFNLDEERTDLAAIGSFLATHADSGLYLTKSLLTKEARRQRLPTGFGSRSRTIEGLFRSASQYEALVTVCDFMERQIEVHRDIWTSWSPRGAEHWATVWTQKLDATHGMIQVLRQVDS